MEKLESIVDIVNSNIKIASFMLLSEEPMTVIDIRDELKDSGVKKQNILSVMEKSLVPYGLVAFDEVPGRRGKGVKGFYLTEKGQGIFESTNFLVSFLLEEYNLAASNVFGAINSTNDKKGNYAKLQAVEEMGGGPISLNELSTHFGYTASRMEKKMTDLINMKNVSGEDVSFVMRNGEYPNSGYLYRTNGFDFKSKGSKVTGLFEFMKNNPSWMSTETLLENCDYSDLASLTKGLRLLGDYVDRDLSTNVQKFALTEEGKAFGKFCLWEMRVSLQGYRSGIMESYPKISPQEYLERVI